MRELKYGYEREWLKAVEIYFDLQARSQKQADRIMGTFAAAAIRIKVQIKKIIREALCERA